MDVRLKHPDGKLTIEVREDVADVYRSQGWQDVPKPKGPPKK